MAKQNLYEFLGVAGDADPDTIGAACRAIRALAERDADARHRQNRLIFLDHAESILLDRRKREQYDRQLNASPTAAKEDTPQRHGSGRNRAVPLLAVLAALGTAWAWWRPDAPAPSAPANVSAPAGPRAAVVLPVREPTAPAAPQAHDNPLLATPAAPPVQSPDEAQAKPPVQYQVVTSGPYAELLAKLAWSVFAILGPNVLGSGVLIDDEKLLTNCHVLAANAGYGHKLYAINSVTRQRTEITRAAYLTFNGEDACLVIAPGLQGHTVELGDLYALQVGAKVHNIGFPQGKLSASDGSYLGTVNINGQSFIQSSNYCDHGVSGGPLVDDKGALIGLTTGGPQDRSRCYSLTVETAKRVLYEPTVRLDEFPGNYVSNMVRR